MRKELKKLKEQAEELVALGDILFKAEGKGMLKVISILEKNKPKMANATILSREYFNGKQSVEFEGLYVYKKNKLKIDIDIDSYDYQSSAKISIFDKQELNWNLLASIPYSKMESTMVFCYRKVDDLLHSEKLAIQKDIDTLLNKAKLIL